MAPMMTLDSDKEDVVRLKKQFKKLTQKPMAEQVKVFCTRYIFLLGEEGYAEVKDAADTFEQACGFNNTELALNDPKTSKFLEDAGHEFVSQFQKNEVFAVLDIDGNRNIALIEYLLYLYKPDILSDYYTRIGQPHRIPEDEDELFACVDPDTGYALISELLENPALRKDSLLDKMTRTILEDQLKLDAEIEELKKKLNSPNNVERKAAEHRLRILEEQNQQGVQDKKRLSIKRRGNIIRAEQRRTVLGYERKKKGAKFSTVAAKGPTGEVVTLPEGWKAYFDDDTNREYYYNESTGVTQWERPT